MTPSGETPCREDHHFAVHNAPSTHRTEPAEHASSPVFESLLSDAVGRLEGAGNEVAQATVGDAYTGSSESTFEGKRITSSCLPTCMGGPTCDGGETCAGVHTCDAQPTCDITCAPQETCYGGVTCDRDSADCWGLTYDVGAPTCDTAVPTCDATETCARFYTCDAQSTCHGEETCDGLFTCWSSTCDGAGLTCDGTPDCCRPAYTFQGNYTCDGTETCQMTCGSWPTCDGSTTCEGGDTCHDTCTGWPACYQGQASGTDRTTWGRVKMVFEE